MNEIDRVSEPKNELCGFCTNGQTPRGWCWSCGGTGIQLTPSEWWELHAELRGKRVTERTSERGKMTDE